MLEDARRELAEARERAQLSPAHTFSPFPNFYKRPAELRAIESILQGDPCFTVLFGASSVGKVSLFMKRRRNSTHRPSPLHEDCATETGPDQLEISCSSFRLADSRFR